MQILISNSSSRPLYEQVEEQIKNAILSGELKPGDPLPSIRYLASELRVSVITTKRAYEELEREGFVQTTQGKGSFVSLSNIERLREIAVCKIEEQLSQAIAAAKSIEMQLPELQEIVQTLYEEGVE